MKKEKKMRERNIWSPQTMGEILICVMCRSGWIPNQVTSAKGKGGKEGEQKVVANKVAK